MKPASDLILINMIGSKNAWMDFVIHRPESVICLLQRYAETSISHPADPRPFRFCDLSCAWEVQASRQTVSLGVKRGSWDFRVSFGLFLHLCPLSPCGNCEPFPHKIVSAYTDCRWRWNSPSAFENYVVVTSLAGSSSPDAKLLSRVYL